MLQNHLGYSETKKLVKYQAELKHSYPKSTLSISGINKSKGFEVAVNVDGIMNSESLQRTKIHAINSRFQINWRS